MIGKKNSLDRELIDSKRAAFASSSMRIDRSRYSASHGSGSLISCSVISNFSVKSDGTISLAMLFNSFQFFVDYRSRGNLNLARNTDLFQHSDHQPNRIKLS